MSLYLPDGVTDADIDRANGGYDDWPEDESNEPLEAVSEHSTGTHWLCWILGCWPYVCQRCGEPSSAPEFMRRSLIDRLLMRLRSLRLKRCQGCREIIGVGAGAPYWCARCVPDEEGRDIPF